MASQKQNKNIALSIKKLSKTFDKKKVLDNVNLNINKNEFVCFLGASGCGKTTLLRIIAGLEHSDKGNIDMFGQNINDLPIKDRDMGIVFQSYALFPNLTVKQNIQYGMDNFDDNKKQSLTKELLSVIGMKDKQNSLPSQLSGGQQQRVALARAIAVSPKILLLDEPLSALDKNIRETLRLEIKRIHKQFKLTTIMVTHDQQEALTMADKIIVMNNSKIEQIGTPEQIYNKPATKYVAGFIGNMSFLPKSITGIKKTVAIRSEDIEILSVGDPSDGHIGIIDTIDFTGANNIFHINVSGEVLSAITQNDTIRGKKISIGDKVKISLPKNKWHIYE